MTRRGTKLSSTSTARGAVAEKVVRWQNFITGQITGASTFLIGGSPGATTPVTTVDPMGKASNTWPMNGLFITTADAVGCLWPDMYDVDLTQPIYFYPGFYTKTGMSAADVMTVAGLYLFSSVVGGIGSANDYGTDRGTSMSGSGGLTLVAGDVVQIKQAPGLYIPGAAGSDNDMLLTTRFTFTLTTASAAEFSLQYVKMRYTKR